MMSGGIGSVISVNLLVVVSIAIGLINNVLIAAVFGLTTRVDAFFAAMVLPSLFMFLCIDYLGKNFLPLFSLAKREGEGSASRMTSTVVTIVFLIAAVVAVLLVVFSGPLFTLLLPGFDESERDLVRRYFLIMAPAIVLMAVNAFHEYVCQHDERFTTVVTIRMVLPISNLIAILALGPVVDEFCLPLGYLAGHAAVFVLMARSARYRFSPSVHVRDRLEKRVFVNSAIVMSTGFIARTKSIVISVLGSTLGSGAISALAMAAKLTEPLERCAFTGAKMFMFSKTARMFAERNERELGKSYSTGLRVSFLALAPLLWWIGLNSQAIVTAFFARGEFTPQMMLLVAGALAAMAPSVLLQGLNQVMANAFYATNRVWVPATTTPFGMLAFVAAAVPLSGILGTQGLALATTVMAAVVFVALLVGLSRVLDGLELGSTAVALLAYAVLAGFAMVAVDGLLSRAGASPTSVAVAGLPLGAAMYLGVLAIARDRTLLDLTRCARRRLALDRSLA